MSKPCAPPWRLALASLSLALEKARTSGRTAFIPYLTAGDPSLGATARFLRALAQENLDRQTDAETSYRQCLFLNRNHPAAQANLAILLAKTGRCDAAERAARSAVRSLAALEPNSELLCPAGPVSVKELTVRLTKPAP